MRMPNGQGVGIVSDDRSQTIRDVGRLLSSCVETFEEAAGTEYYIEVRLVDDEPWQIKELFPEAETETEAVQMLINAALEECGMCYRLGTPNMALGRYRPCFPVLRREAAR